MQFETFCGKMLVVGKGMGYAGFFHPDKTGAVYQTYFAAGPEFEAPKCFFMKNLVNPAHLENRQKFVLKTSGCVKS